MKLASLLVTLLMSSHVFAFANMPRNPNLSGSDRPVPVAQDIDYKTDADGMPTDESGLAEDDAEDAALELFGGGSEEDDLSYRPESIGGANLLYVVVNKSSQRMRVTDERGSELMYTKVSTARAGYVTPAGSYRIQRTAKMWYSKKYHNSPMPHSLFFRGGYAIHGTGDLKHLGSPASHGCVRLHPNDAADLYSLAFVYGTKNVRIIIQ